jgi:hypothetical protein
MQYYYLKIGKGNSLATDWLAGKNPLKRPAAVIFFGELPIEDTLNNRQVNDFYLSSLPEKRDNTIMVTIGDGKAWFLKPAGEIVECDPPPDATENLNNLWKMMPVEVISEQKLSKIPPVLAGINANAFLSRGTYRKITNWGNIKAIYCSLQKPLPDEHLQIENCNALRLLECLSSVELETLVAKIFEASGCFVPAYRGGCIRDVDLFVRNDTDEDINLSSLIIPAHHRLSIQVKGRTRLKECPKEVNCLIGFEVPQVSNCFDEEWLLKQIKRFPKVNDWLSRSLDWLPQEFLVKCGL